jgi:putative transposase
MEEDSKGTELSNVIRIDDERVRDHLGRIVRGTVEETLRLRSGQALNAMLEAEADRLCNAGCYEHTAARRDQAHLGWRSSQRVIAGGDLGQCRGDLPCFIGPVLT